jgi:hypothetical protein
MIGSLEWSGSMASSSSSHPPTLPIAPLSLCSSRKSGERVEQKEKMKGPFFDCKYVAHIC